MLEYMLEYIQQNYKVLNRIKNYDSEIGYILHLSEDNFEFSSPEVLYYCFIIINQCITEIYNNHKIEDDQLYFKINKYLQ